MSQLSFVENFLISGVAAGVAKTCTAPIERVKLNIQNQDEMMKAGRLDKPYTGIVDCAKRVAAAEGIAAFWRGNLANVIRYFPTQALNFAFKDSIKEVFNCPKDAGLVQKFGTNIASGGFAGSLSLMFVYSLDFVRTRMANDAKSKDGTRQFNGLIDCYKKTIAADGVAGLYRGFVISCVGIFIYRGMYFGLYDSLKPILLGEKPSAFLSFILGWVVTTVAGLGGYPIDTVRRRMMMTSGTAVKYNGSMDAFSQIVKAEGTKSLFKGAGANVMRGMGGAGVLVGCDILKEAYVKFKSG